MTVNLLKNVENYAKFVSQVLHDETFLVELDKTLPFDKMVNATMNIASNHTPNQENGCVGHANGYRATSIFNRNNPAIQRKGWSHT